MQLQHPGDVLADVFWGGGAEGRPPAPQPGSPVAACSCGGSRAALDTTPPLARDPAALLLVRSGAPSLFCTSVSILFLICH